MIATSISQSKRLLELGIKAETADMFWLVTSKPHLHVLTEDLSNYDRWENYPAWSLTALLNLMPIPIKMNGNFAYPHVGLFDQSIDYLEGMAVYKTIKGKTLIDAAVEMIEWLVTNKHLEV